MTAEGCKNDGGGVWLRGWCCMALLGSRVPDVSELVQAGIIGGEYGEFLIFNGLLFDRAVAALISYSGRVGSVSLRCLPRICQLSLVKISRIKDITDYGPK